MTEKEMFKVTLDEFSRLQDYLSLTDESQAVYKPMLTRYHDLKALLQSFGLNLTEIDRLKL